ncbi:hypothetical protein SSS_08745 [Sarcoptes scabiei]|uniref:Uncharacterized protein n=1 Tax=Sarcoptes scabiei TaxID=52283 RepID=A0A834RC31_SARSC|nr:hypothetical protein SSS_08745 [Sarcoptes scabiei]
MRQHQEQQRQRMRAQQEQERMMERRQRGSRPEAIEESMIDDYEELELEKQEKKKKSLLSFLKKKKKNSSYFDSVRIFTLASSYFPSIYDLENDLTMVTFKEYPEFPSRCSLQTSEDQFYQLRSQHRACRRKNIEKHHLTIETLLTESKEFCCFVFDSFDCEDNILKQCDQRSADMNNAEKEKLVDACGQWTQKRCAEVIYGSNSYWWLEAGAGGIAAILSIFGASWLVGSYRKILWANLIGKKLPIEFLNEFQSQPNWRHRIFSKCLKFALTKSSNHLIKIVDLPESKDSMVNLLESIPKSSNEPKNLIIDTENQMRLSIDSTERPKSWNTSPEPPSLVAVKEIITEKLDISNKIEDPIWDFVPSKTLNTSSELIPDKLVDKEFHFRKVPIPNPKTDRPQKIPEFSWEEILQRKELAKVNKQFLLQYKHWFMEKKWPMTIKEIDKMHSKQIDKTVVDFFLNINEKPTNELDTSLKSKKKKKKFGFRKSKIQ